MGLRDIAPKITVPGRIEVLPVEKHVSPAGYALHAINSSDVEVLKICFVFHAGVKYQTRPFQASATLSLLSEGTQKYTSKEIAEKMDFYGIYFDANIDRDYSVITVCCLKKFLDPSLDLLKEIMTQPTFPENELRLHCAKRMQAIRIEREKVDYQAREKFAEALFGPDHPYGTIPDIDAYNDLTTESLENFFNRHYTFENSFCVVSGQIDDADIENILRVGDSLPRGMNLDRNFPVVSVPRNVYVEKPEVLQSSLRIGKVLFNRTHPDYIGMQVVSTLLGGYFSSRIIRNIREDKGYTYGAFAGMVNMEDSGFFAVSTEVAAQFTDEAVAEIVKEIEQLREQPVSEEELSTVKNVMIGNIIRVLDGPFGIADVTVENLSNGEDNAYIDRMIEEINRTTPERVRQLAVRYLAPDTLTFVTVGKSSKQSL